jgi:hypothetical protein
MIDGLGRLRNNPMLQQLLAHYAEARATDGEGWQDRLSQLDGAGPRELTQLHGELIAFGWVEQNTGNTTPFKPGTVAACYRATAAGVRALKRARSAGPVDEGEAADLEPAA